MINELERKYGHRFSKKSCLIVTNEAYEELRKHGASAESAFETAIRWMKKYGRSPSEKEMDRFLSEALEYHSLITLLIYGIALDNWAFGHFSLRKKSLLPALLLPLMPSGGLTVESRNFLLWAISKIKIISRDTINMDDMARVGLTELVIREAILLMDSPDVEDHEHALQMLREKREAIRFETEDNLQFSYGRLLFEMALLLKSRLEGDIFENRKESVVLLEECLALPARQADKVRRAITLAQLGSAYRLFAKLHSDLLERRSLLERSVSAYKDSQNFFRQNQIPAEYIDHAKGAEINYVSAQLDLLELLHRPDEITEETFQNYSRSLATQGMNSVKTYLHKSGEICTQQNRFQTILGTLEAYPQAKLIEVLKSIRDESNYPDTLTQVQIQLLITTLKENFEEDLASEIWPLLEQVLGRVNPLACGIAMARQLQLAELLIALPKNEGGRPGAPANYLERRIYTLNASLSDPIQTSSHLKLTSSWIGHLAKLRLALPTTPQDRLKWIDLLGFSAFRADCQFFGQGPANEHSNHDEYRWRCNLYRTRGSLDRAQERLDILNFSKYEENPELLASMKIYAQSDEYIQDQTGQFHRDFQRPDVEAELERKELRNNIVFGHSRGWSPAVEFNVPSLICADIIKWLNDRRNTALLVVETGPHPMWLALPDGDKLVSIQISTSKPSDVRTFFEAVERLIEAELRIWSGEEPCEEHNQALDNYNCIAKPLAEKLVDICEVHGITRIALLARGFLAQIPWESIPISNNDLLMTLGEKLSVIHLSTLATGHQEQALARPGRFTYIGAGQSTKTPLGFGASILSASDPDAVFAMADRDQLESFMCSCGVLRILTHGGFFPAGDSFLGLDESDSTASSTDRTYTTGEIRSLDLVGCRRVELWACESGFGTEFLATQIWYDEPAAIGSAFLLAGAARNIASLWKQPSLPACLIAAAFSKFVKANGDAFDDAWALSRAVQWYRSLIDHGGIFERTAEQILMTPEIRSVEPLEIRSRIIKAAVISALTDLGINGFQWQGPVPEGILGPVPSQAANEAEMLQTDPQKIMNDWFASYRSPWAWSGWRVTVRDMGTT